jgi:hypothetical protein
MTAPNLARIGGVGYNIGSMQRLNASAKRSLTTLDEVSCTTPYQRIIFLR